MLKQSSFKKQKLLLFLNSCQNQLTQKFHHKENITVKIFHLIALFKDLPCHCAKKELPYYETHVKDLP